MPGTIFHAFLALAVYLAFSCTLRIGEITGLTWDCIDISPEAIARKEASLYVNKEISRVNKEKLTELGEDKILYIFPPSQKNSKTVLVFKNPKSETSIRKVYIPETVANLLAEWKKKQDEWISTLGNEYENYNLVFTTDHGRPIEGNSISKKFKGLAEKYDLNPVVFHSLRHTSITTKLKLSEGNVKSVQGDSGHAQSKMVTDLHAHILDSDRKKTAEIFEKAFYQKADQSNQGEGGTGGISPEIMEKLLENPNARELILALAKNLG